MKKVLSIVLSIAMVLCMMPAMAFAGTTSAQADAAYSDTAGTACEGAVNVLSALGVVNGYSDGTYKPEQVVTRAEMAKLIITALGVDTYAQATTSKFTDMGAASWAIPYVEYASNLNIVNGYGYGLFGPNDTVTYEQAVTMIVRALGYTDDCKEMNGSWPAIYVQKATALGLFSNVVNGGAAGADRGDVAIMLYNALDLAEVYADNEGATQYKTGTNPVQYGASTVLGVSMLGVLNQDGHQGYSVLDANDADTAVINVRGYVGAIGKIYTNKDGDVISIGDVKSTFISGTVNGDGDEFTTTEGTVYRVDADAFSKVNADGTISNNQASVYKLVNGAVDGTYAKVATEKGALDSVAQNKTVTLAAKVNGKTISNIFAIAEWNKSGNYAGKLAEDTDINKIAKDKKIKDYSFKLDNDGEIDTTTFTLKGVESVSDIAEDNVIYVYADKNNIIRKVEVGTEVVEGTFEEFSAGTAKAAATATSLGGNNGKQATFVIDGKSYNGTNTSPATPTVPEDWTKSDNSEGVTPGDSVKAYLDASGAIFQIEQVEAGATDYAMVLAYELYESNGATPPVYGGTKHVNKDSAGGATLADATVVGAEAGLNGDSSIVKVMNADGSVNTLKFKDGVSVPQGFGLGTIISYKLNSSNKIKSVTLESQNAVSPMSAGTEDITTKGYYCGMAIADTAVIFTLDSNIVAGTAIDEDDVNVTTLDAVAGSEDVIGISYVTNSKNSKYTALVLDGTNTSSSVKYGIITKLTAIDSESVSGADYRAAVLYADGTTANLYVDDSLAVSENVFYAFKLNAQGYIGKIDSVNTGSGVFDATGFDTNASVLGTKGSSTAGINWNNGAIAGCTNIGAAGTTITIDPDAVFLKWSANSGSFTVGTKDDFTDATSSAGSNVSILVDTDKDKDKDGIADLVIIAKADTAANTAAGSSYKSVLGNATTWYSATVASTVAIPSSLSNDISFGTVTIDTTTVASGENVIVSVPYTVGSTAINTKKVVVTVSATGASAPAAQEIAIGTAAGANGTLNFTVSNATGNVVATATITEV